MQISLPLRATRRFRARFSEPSIVLWIGIAALLIFLVVNPLWQLVRLSLSAPDTGAVTLDNYVAAFSHWRTRLALWHSLELGVAVTVICLVIAIPLAWAVSRTDLPGKGLIRLFVLMAFVTPSYLGAIGWMLLAGPNAGWLNRVWRAATGAHFGLFNVYSFSGLAFVIALYSFPYLFIFTSTALDVVSSEMEDAANILGAGILRTTWRVTLPMVLPAILGGVIITFLEAIAIFGTPALIAIPARFNVLTIQLWEFFSPPIRAEVAAAYALPLLLITVLMFWVQRALTRRRGFVALTGKGGERRLIPLGHWRWPMLGYAWLVIALAVLLPYGALSQAAFAVAWGRGWHWANVTVANFHYLLFVNATADRAIVNSFLYAGAAASLVIVLSLAVAYIAARRLLPLAGLLSFLCLAPFVIPGIVLAVAFYAAYAPPPLALYGTALILILAFATRFLPIGYASATAAVGAINPEMEDAVRTLGGGRLLAVRRVLAPLMRRNLIGAWLLVFIPATRELSTAMFLYGPNTRTISVTLLDMSEQGNFEHLAALGFILLAATGVIVAVGMRLVGRDFMLQRDRS